MSQPTAAVRVHGYAQQLRITGNSIERHMSQPTAVRLWHLGLIIRLQHSLVVPEAVSRFSAALAATQLNLIK